MNRFLIIVAAFTILCTCKTSLSQNEGGKSNNGGAWNDTAIDAGFRWIKNTPWDGAVFRPRNEITISYEIQLENREKVLIKIVVTAELYKRNWFKKHPNEPDFIFIKGLSKSRIMDPLSTESLASGFSKKFDGDCPEGVYIVRFSTKSARIGIDGRPMGAWQNGPDKVRHFLVEFN